MEWIKVEDKLPEYGVKVLACYYPRQPVMEGTIIGILNRIKPTGNPLTDRLIDENHFGLASKVTHWIQLPQKPNEGE